MLAFAQVPHHYTINEKYLNGSCGVVIVLGCIDRRVINAYYTALTVHNECRGATKTAKEVSAINEMNTHHKSE